MRRTPFSLWLLTFFGVLLAIWMTFNGLYIRLFGDFFQLQRVPLLWLHSPGSPSQGVLSIGIAIAPDKVAWPFVAIGAAWFGALSALWLRFRGGVRVVAFFAVLSFTLLGLGTILSALILICLWLPATKGWLVEET